MATTIDRAGGLSIAPSLLREAGILRGSVSGARAGRAHVRRADDGLLISRCAADADEADAGQGRQRDAAPRRVTWVPAEVEVHSVSGGLGRGARRRIVIDDLSVSFAAGRLTVVTGRSGTGKTTLLRLLAGLDPPDSGEVSLDGRSVGGPDREQAAGLRRERIGYLAQEPAPVGFLTGEENVQLALRLRDWDGADAAAHATEVLRGLGLADRASQRVDRLSAGETQRVALARAIAGARGLLIVDEPTSRLDEASAELVAGVLARVAAEQAQTVICATHDAGLIGLGDAVVDLGDLSRRPGRAG